MKKLYYGLFLLLLPCLIQAQNSVGNVPYTYIPDSKELHDEILRMDSIFFEAYNKCKMDVQAAIYADSIEFYHDNGGLTNSKQELLESTKKYICEKVTRALVPGSVEVYPIKGFGAIEIGLHRFFSKEEPDAKPHDSKFIIIWKQEAKGWRITRVVSLH